MTYVALAAAGLACGGATEPLPACSQGVSISVTEGRTPTIAWTPKCTVAALVVSETQLDVPGGSEGVTWRWSLTADDPVIEPPIRYGRNPPGVRATTAQPLQVGRSYQVSVRDRLDSPHMLGVKTFTP